MLTTIDDNKYGLLLWKLGDLPYDQAVEARREMEELYHKHNVLLAEIGKVGRQFEAKARMIDRQLNRSDK